MGELCVYLMDEKGMTQAALAKYLTEQCGKSIHRARVSEWISATKIDDDEIKVIESSSNPKAELNKLLRARSNRNGNIAISRFRNIIQEINMELDRGFDSLKSQQRLQVLGMLRDLRKRLEDLE